MRVFRGDHVNGDPKTATNIKKAFNLIKTFVTLKELVHNNSGVIDHGSIENMIEPGVEAGIIKGVCAMNPVERNTPFPNRIFKLRPKNE